ncbi:uncharacterized protein [Macrobrachium rosenbergii]|uniref:uncharacterized protein n=1 Tax=Macrobrachium rosenbergii TaxID=79674 RepID=UPI0034D635EC
MNARKGNIGMNDYNVLSLRPPSTGKPLEPSPLCFILSHCHPPQLPPLNLHHPSPDLPDSLSSLFISFGRDQPHPTPPSPKPGRHPTPFPIKVTQGPVSRQKSPLPRPLSINGLLPNPITPEGTDCLTIAPSSSSLLLLLPPPPPPPPSLRPVPASERLTPPLLPHHKPPP